MCVCGCGRGNRRLCLLGQNFGRLTVIRLDHIQRHAYWRCRCACGKEGVARASHLKSGNIQSCGCLQRQVTSKRMAGRTGEKSYRFGKPGLRGEKNPNYGKRGTELGGYKHGWTNTPTYRSWQAMLQRCTNPNIPQWLDYGGRGIRVCSGLREFTDFLSVMGERPDKTTLDRFPDNDANYSCGHCSECIENGWKLNVRWATRQQQRATQRDNSRVDIPDTEILTLYESGLSTVVIGKQFGAAPSLINKKLRLLGVPIRVLGTNQFSKEKTV